MNNIIVTGSLSYDYIMDFRGLFCDRIMPDKIHKISLSFLVDKLNKQLGGTAGNIGYSLKLLGVDPIIIAPAGRDFEIYEQFLIKNNINLSGIVKFPKSDTSSYFVITDKEDNQIGSFYSGALKHAQSLSIKKFIDKNKSFIILSPTDPKAMVKYVRECRGNNYPYMYDPAFQIATFTKDELLEGIDGAQILIGNDYEICLLEQKLGISHEELIVSVPILVTTLGSKGSIIETRNESIHIKPALAKNTSDPTGAGDAYRAGFIAGYIRGFDLVTCGQMGSVSAVYTVEKYGTVTHTYTTEQFIDRYQENYREKLKI